MVTDAEQGQVYLVSLDPTTRGEIKKTRPCVAVSPDDLNAHMRTCSIAPMTTVSHAYPFRIPCRFQGTAGHVVLDGVRTVDRARLVKSLDRFLLKP